jgi:hypothetical protein
MRCLLAVNPPKSCLKILILLAFGVGTLAAATASAEPLEAEKRTAAELEKIRQEPLLLRTFLKAMPKGADPHNHLDGAVYAETFIRVGGEDGFCVDPLAKAFTKSQPIKSGAAPAPVCEAGDVPSADVPKHQLLYGALVDSFSMRGFVPSEGVTGHDHFFGTFAKFGGTDPRHTGEFLHEVTNRAAAQNEQYLELMETPTIDLTHEYVRAVETYGLTYADLKQIVRNSLEYSFLPGDSLWQDRGAYTRLAADCAEDADRADAPSSACAGVLGKSEKAEQQWELERRFRKFEEGFLATGP